MRYYPVYLDIENQKCLVVGGGSVGTRKVMTLLSCGASITVVSPKVTDELLGLARKKAIALKRRSYQTPDLEGVILVIGATDDEQLNGLVSRDARHLNKLCNIVDRPEACNFIIPSVISRGDLVVAISTSGKSPAFSKKMRKELESQFGEEYAEFLQLMGAIRQKLLANGKEPEYYKPLFEKLVNSELVGMIKNKNKEGIDLLLKKTLGKGFEFDNLISKNE